MIDFSEWTDRPWPVIVCRVCGTENDNVMGKGMPRAGDVNICLRCGGITIFTGGDGSVREPTMEEVEVIKENGDIQKMIWAIRQANRQVKEGSGDVSSD